MLDSILFPDSSNLCIDSVSVENQVIVIAVLSTSTFWFCPHCQRTSQRVHSRYVRHPADLPLAACTVRLKITVHRFFCDNTDCPCITFAERIPAVLKPYARHTNRLIVYLRQIAFALGGEAGARLLRKRGVPVSPDTLLRIIRNTKEPEVKTPRVLGVDDWAFRKGHS